jgi:hypothetical protein
MPQGKLMRQLEDMPLVWRLALAAMIVALAIIVLLILTWAFDGNEASGQAVEEPRLYQGIPLDAALLHLDKRALEEAYHAQLLKLFGVWLTQGAPEDAKNIQNGLKIARRAYSQAAHQIAVREQQLLEMEHQQQEQPK